MNFRIFTGPSRETTLDELFRRTPVGDGRVCAVVPDPVSFVRLERRIARIAGGAALGVRLYTFEQLARAIVSYDHIPPALIPGHLKKALIREIIKSRIGSRSRWYPISSTPGFTALVASFLEDIRSGAGTTAHDPDLMAIERAYESHLARLGMTDHEGFVSLALEGNTAGKFAAAFDGPLIIDGFYDLTPRQFELISRLATVFRRSAAAVVYDPASPVLFSLAGELCQRFCGIGAVTVEVPAEPTKPVERILAAFTGTEDNSTSVSAGDKVEIHTFRSESAEADWIAGTIGTLITLRGFSADDIMVVTRETPAADGPLHTYIRRHGIPSVSGPSGRIAAHPLVRHILNAFEASVTPSENRIADVLKSCYTLSGEMHALLGGSTDTRGWSTMIAATDSPGGFAESIERMIDALGIIGAIEKDCDENRKRRDLAALEFFRALHADFAAFYRPFRPMLDAREYNRLLALFLSDSFLPAESASSRGVLVTSALHARFIDRPVIFMAGLSADSFPARHDRFSLHTPAIAQSVRERREREEPLLFRLSASGAHQLYFTFPGLDNEGSAAGMSPYLREIATLTGIVPQSHAGVPGAAWEEGASGKRGRMEQIMRFVRAAVPSGSEFLRCLQVRSQEIAAIITDAIERRRLGALRAGLTLTHPLSHGQLCLDWGGKREFAVTALENYRTCPVGFFFRRLLGVDTAEIMENSLDSLERGSIIHDILALFYERLRIETGGTRLTMNNLQSSVILMETVVHEVFDSWRYQLRRFKPVVFEAERNQIARWLAAVLQLEAKVMESSPYAPAFFEVSFGGGIPMDIGTEETPLLLRGRIDRIDLTSDEQPSARVIDYKTGQKTTTADINTGKAIQLPVYLRAAAALLPQGAKVREGLYYNLREASFNEKNHRLTQCPVITEDIESIIERACEFAREAAGGIRSGVFPPPEKCNRFCDLKPLCRGGMTAGEEDADAGQ